MALQTLGSPNKNVRSTASLVIGRIGSIELAAGKWPDLVDNLVDGIKQTANANLREAAFEALGYVAEEVPGSLAGKTLIVLNAIGSGMDAKETNMSIKYAATQALGNALEACKAHFESNDDRNLIMRMIFSSAKVEDVRVRVAAYQALNSVVALYYEYLKPYMADIFVLTATAIQKEPEEVALQAIEFWSSVCDVELIITDELEEAAKLRQQPRRQLLNFANQALQNLCPLLFECLLKQHEDLGDEDWNTAMAAGTCLSLLAQVTQNNIVKHVLPFVIGNINSTKSWRNREAATLAFGCILDGPSKADLKKVVTDAFPWILVQMKDEHPVVKDTAAWTIGRICHLLPETIDDKILPGLMDAIITGLVQQPKVAANVCWAVHNLAQMVEVGEEDTTSPLSAYFQLLMKGLFAATERADMHESNLMNSAYEAITSLIQSAAPDVNPLISQAFPILMNRLKQTIGHTDPKVAETQGLLCSAIQSVVKKLGEDVLTEKVFDEIMTLLLGVLTSKRGGTGELSATVEEALMAIGAVADRTKGKFIKYATPVMPIVNAGLKATKEKHLCVVSVGLVGDISRALEAKMIPWTDELVTTLLANFQSGTIHRSIKPHIASGMSDIALAVGGHFERYLPFLMPMLIAASAMQPESASLDDIEWIEKLREAILEAYTGILQGMGSDNRAQAFLPFLDNVTPFLVLIAKDEHRTEEVLRSACGVIGDIAAKLEKAALPHLAQPHIGTLLKAGLESSDEDTQANAHYAKQAIEKLSRS